jgi:hypothetical protein
MLAASLFQRLAFARQSRQDRRQRQHREGGLTHAHFRPLVSAKTLRVPIGCIITGWIQIKAGAVPSLLIPSRARMTLQSKLRPSLRFTRHRDRGLGRAPRTCGGCWLGVGPCHSSKRQNDIRSPPRRGPVLSAKDWVPAFHRRAAENLVIKNPRL